MRAISQHKLLADTMLRIGLCDGESACQTHAANTPHVWSGHPGRARLNCRWLTWSCSTVRLGARVTSPNACSSSANAVCNMLLLNVIAHRAYD